MTIRENQTTEFKAIWKDGYLKHICAFANSQGGKLYIADIFFKSGYIEAWGRGIEKIMNGFKRENLPAPLIEELAGGVQITMYNQVNSKQSKNDTINDTLNDTINDTINARQLVIIKLINNNKHITISEIAEKTNVGVATVKRDIDALKANDILKRIGSRKNGYWQINLKKT